MPIFDQGYQYWSGTLSGHALRWLTITRHGVRVGMKNIFLRLLVILSWLPAVGLAFMLCLWGLLEQKSSLVAPLLPFLSGLFNPDMLANPRNYRVDIWTLSFHYFMQIELTISMVVILLVGPGLISQDLRFNALPLYFSRPLRRIDYFVGKLGVVGWFLGLVVVVPSLIAYVLGLFFSLDITILWDTLPLLLACLAYGAVIVLSAGTLVLALSSLSRNSRYIALFWVALWFISNFVSVVLEGVNQAQRLSERQHKALTAAREQPNRRLTPQEVNTLQEASLKAEREEDRQASQTDWRPLVSYTDNLSCIGRQLLGTDAAWRDLARLLPEQQRERFLAAWLGPQYPWYWSAGVLAVLFGFSACILNSRIRSLDRLK